MTQFELVLSCINADPGGLTNAEIAKQTGLTPNSVSAITSQLYTKKKQVRRITGKAGYLVYFPLANAATPSEPAPKVEAPAKPAEPATAPVVKPQPAPKVEVPVKQSIAEHSANLSGLIAKFDDFATQLAAHFAARLKGKLVEEMMAISLPHVPVQPAPVMPTVEELQARIAGAAPAPAAPVLKRVTIIGLLPQQSGMIQNEFHDVFNLAFFKDGPAQQLRDVVRNADHVITFTSKIPHHFENIIKSAGKEVIRAYGGMTELRDRLMKLYVEGGN